MSDPKKINLDFGDIVSEQKDRPTHAQIKAVAGATGVAEGFTTRGISHKKQRPLTVQLNLKVPVDFKDRYMARADLEIDNNRAIRSAGEFLVMVFEQWEGKSR
ncbi:MAG: hypothetical protein HIU90_07555 [Proteobacteria bacterium]|nr:hypothetical protein [Pseudomonadota bacterium]